MSTSADRRALRLVGALVLGMLQVGGAVLVLSADTTVPRPGWRIPAETPDVLGVVEQYGDDAIMVTTMEGPAEIRVDASTVVTRLTEPATLDEIVPGDKIFVWGKNPARVILTGAPRR